MTNTKSSFLLIFLLLVSIIACSNSDDKPEKVIDTEKPTINCIENIDMHINSTSSSVVITYESPIGTDNVSATTKQTAGLPSGASFPLGVTTNTFEVTDPSGNSASCSFDVVITQDAVLGSQPFFDGNNPTPSGKQWAKVEDLSDEFNGSSFDDAKWYKDPANDPFGWYGRAPALFEADNVTVSDGNLNITVEKFSSPKHVRNINWTHGGAIIRSKGKAKQGHYYECKMKANKTIMSSTFWIAFQQNCNSGPIRKLELDIQECVGRVHSGTHAWASKWDNIYHSNAIRHNRTCDIGEETRKSGVLNLTEKNHERFFVYGCWWKSPTELLFYLDGKYAYSITPTTNFDLEGHITMAIETYNWNPVDEAGSIFETGSFDDLTTKYDWVRTWKLEDK